YGGSGNYLPSSSTVLVTILPSVFVLDPTASGALSLSGNATLTITGAVQVDSNSASAVSLSGNAQLTASGIHVVGGARATGNASAGGSAVLIYNAGSNYPSPGGSYGGLSLSGNGTIDLAPAATGTYAGILIFQPSANPRALSLGGNAMLLHEGLIYAPAALVSVSGNGQLHALLVVDQLQL